MSTSATPKTALLTGIGTGLCGVLVGPYIDHATGLGGDILIVLAALSAGVPAYFFVFGLKKSQLVGLWMLERDLLKREGAWLLGVWSVASAVGLILFFVRQ